MEISQHEVVIVGAGPTGLALAAELRRLGVPAAILDRLPSGANTSRAAAVHARTLEVLEPLGISPELIQNGLVAQTFQVRERDRILASVSFKDLDTAYPFVLMCPQDVTEAILLRRLEALGGKVERPCEAVSISPSGDTVELRVQRGEDLHAMRAQWLVGCDGMHSRVREEAGIAFEGGAYEESFVLADVEMDWPFDRTAANLFFSEEGLMLVAPLPEDRFRIVATVQQAPEAPSMAEFMQILKERGPATGEVQIRRMAWSSRFHIHHRVATVLRRGRVLLAGDAAHVHSPAGGQGMNIGIQDAISLAAALHQVLTTGDEAALSAWEQKRLEIAHSVVNMTDRLTRFATSSSPAARLLRNAALGLIGHFPRAQHALVEKLSELDNR